MSKASWLTGLSEKSSLPCQAESKQATKPLQPQECADFSPQGNSYLLLRNLLKVVNVYIQYSNLDFNAVYLILPWYFPESLGV